MCVAGSNEINRPLREGFLLFVSHLPAPGMATTVGRPAARHHMPHHDTSCAPDQSAMRSTSHIERGFLLLIPPLPAPGMATTRWLSSCCVLSVLHPSAMRSASHISRGFLLLVGALPGFGAATPVAVELIRHCSVLNVLSLRRQSAMRSISPIKRGILLLVSHLPALGMVTRGGCRADFRVAFNTQLRAAVKESS